MDSLVLAGGQDQGCGHGHVCCDAVVLPQHQMGMSGSIDGGS